jgi:hypothetical protein
VLVLYTRGPFIPAAGGRSNTVATGCFEHNGCDSRLSTHLEKERPSLLTAVFTVVATTRPKLRYTRLGSETKRSGGCVMTGGGEARKERDEK